MIGEVQLISYLEGVRSTIDTGFGAKVTVVIGEDPAYLQDFPTAPAIIVEAEQFDFDFEPDGGCSMLTDVMMNAHFLLAYNPDVATKSANIFSEVRSFALAGAKLITRNDFGIDFANKASIGRGTPGRIEPKVHGHVSFVVSWVQQLNITNLLTDAERALINNFDKITVQHDLGGDTRDPILEIED